MKRILLTSIAGAAAVMNIARANAADLGLRPMYAAPRAFTWSGCYIGGNIGGGWDRVMLYAKGGAAWAGDKYSADLPAFNEHIATSVTRPGWTVGGGVEWAFWENWSAKVEYDYYDFSTRNLALAGTIFGAPEIVPGINVKETISTVKFGINYRFGPY